MSRYLSALLSFLFLIPAAAMCFFPMRNQLKYKPARIMLHVFVLFVVMLPLPAWLIARFSLDINLVLFPLLVLFYVFYQQSLQTHPSKSLAIYSIICALTGSLANIAGGLTLLWFPDSGANAPAPFGALFRFGLTALAAVLFFWPLYRFGSYLIDNLHINRVWYATIPFSVLLLAMQVALRPAENRFLQTRPDLFAYWFLVLLTLLTQLLLIVFFYYIVVWILRYSKLRERTRILEMQESQYEAQQKYIESSAAARHDFKQAIRTLYGLFRSGDNDALQAYFDRYLQTIPENDVVRYCRNSALNALLNYYAHSAAQDGTSIKLRIDLPEAPVVSDPDLCSMIGNILENAVTACREMETGARWIVLTVTVMHRTQLCIVAANSFNGRVNLRDGQYRSTRRSGGGVGLTSIRAAAERCGGTADFSHEGTEFYSNIMIPLPAVDAADGSTHP